MLLLRIGHRTSATSVYYIGILVYVYVFLSAADLCGRPTMDLSAFNVQGILFGRIGVTRANIIILCRKKEKQWTRALKHKGK